VAQNIIERYPDAKLRVYVVWVPRWASDARSEIDGGGLVDARVTHLWDAGKVVGQPLLDRFGVTFGGLDYDFYLLFDRDATWDSTPPKPVSSGATVIDHNDRLARDLVPLLG
jgi:hypothetical protein